MVRGGLVLRVVRIFYSLGNMLSKKLRMCSSFNKVDSVDWREWTGQNNSEVIELIQNIDATYQVLVKLSDTDMLLLYDDNFNSSHGFCRVLSIVGNEVSVSSPVKWNQASTTYIQAQLVSEDSEYIKICVIFRSGSIGRTRILLVHKASLEVSMGATFSLSSDNSGQTSSLCVFDNSHVLSIMKVNGKLEALLLHIQGLNLEVVDRSVIESQQVSTSFVFIQSESQAICFFGVGAKQELCCVVIHKTQENTLDFDPKSLVLPELYSSLNHDNIAIEQLNSEVFGIAYRSYLYAKPLFTFFSVQNSLVDIISSIEIDNESGGAYVSLVSLNQSTVLLAIRSPYYNNNLELITISLEETAELGNRLGIFAATSFGTRNFLIGTLSYSKALALYCDRFNNILYACVINP